MTRIPSSAALIIAACALAACSRQAQERAADTGEQIKQAAEDTGDFAKDAAKSAGDVVKDSAENAVGAADALVQNVDVRAALIGDKRVDSSHIAVDADTLAKSITLKGSVPTAEQKTLAGQIAAEHAKGYAIHNELTIGS